jgi:hypothetical protein
VQGRARAKRRGRKPIPLAGEARHTPPAVTPLALLLLAAAPAPEAPVDFIDAVRPLFQVVTCQPGDLPPGFDAKAVAAYCDTQRPRFERYQKHWGRAAQDFLAALRPAGLPEELVYPFGGGDLMSALMAFPDARVTRCRSSSRATRGT